MKKVITVLAFSLFVFLSFASGENIPGGEGKEMFLFSIPDGYYEVDMDMPTYQMKKISYDTGSTTAVFAIQDIRRICTLSLKLQPGGVQNMQELRLNAEAFVRNSAWHGEITDVTGKRLSGYSIASQSRRSKNYLIQAFLYFDKKFYIHVMIKSDNKEENDLLNSIYSALENSKVKLFRGGQLVKDGAANDLTVSSEKAPSLKKRLQQLLDAPDNKEFLDSVTNDEIGTWKSLAEKNDPEAQFLYGLCYIEGSHFPKDAGTGAMWLRKAAEQNLGVAQEWLGALYRDGIGVQKNDSDALKWFVKAAEQGDSFAQRDLGYCYQDGTGVAKNEKEAFKWFQKAADNGEPEAQCGLGLLYYNGAGVEQNSDQAFKYWARSAIQNNTEAQFYLGNCYESAFGVVADIPEAIKWYRKAADNGDADSLEKLKLLEAASSMRGKK